MSILSDDYCRCLDDTCPKHETCRRWIERGRSNTGFASVADTLLSKYKWDDNNLVPKTPKQLELERKHGCDFYVEAKKCGHKRT